MSGDYFDCRNPCGTPAEHPQTTLSYAMRVSFFVVGFLSLCAGVGVCVAFNPYFGIPAFVVGVALLVIGSTLGQYRRENPSSTQTNTYTDQASDSTAQTYTYTDQANDSTAQTYTYTDQTNTSMTQTHSQTPQFPQNERWRSLPQIGVLGSAPFYHQFDSNCWELTTEEQYALNYIASNPRDREGDHIGREIIGACALMNMGRPQYFHTEERVGQGNQSPPENNAETFLRGLIQENSRFEQLLQTYQNIDNGSEQIQPDTENVRIALPILRRVLEKIRNNLPTQESTSTTETTSQTQTHPLTGNEGWRSLPQGKNPHYYQFAAEGNWHLTEEEQYALNYVAHNPRIHLGGYHAQHISRHFNTMSLLNLNANHTNNEEFLRRFREGNHPFLTILHSYEAIVSSENEAPEVDLENVRIALPILQRVLEKIRNNLPTQESTATTETTSQTQTHPSPRNERWRSLPQGNTPHYHQFAEGDKWHLTEKEQYAFNYVAHNRKEYLGGFFGKQIIQIFNNLNEWNLNTDKEFLRCLSEGRHRFSAILLSYQNIINSENKDPEEDLENVRIAYPILLDVLQKIRNNLAI